MHSWGANGDSPLFLWLRVRDYAVPPSMIESATARRRVGDWAGACAAARVDVDLNLRFVARVHGHELATLIRADLRRLAPDLLRWHMPRVAPAGLLRPGLTIALARYSTEGHGGVQLVARTPPAWADAGQRISLALWDGTRSRDRPCPHPHPRPDRRFRLDLHRHLWDARRTGELRVRSGADRPPGNDAGTVHASHGVGGCPATDRWAAEADILLRAEGRHGDAVAVRLAAKRWLALRLAPTTDTRARIVSTSVGERFPELAVLPDAATWALPDLLLLRAGLIDADRLHPLVASALVPGHPVVGASRIPDGTAQPRLVECRGARHRIGLVNGVLVPLDHDPDEIRREELLAALTGTPLPCLQAIDETHRRPEDLADIRARLEHGDTVGALAAVEGLLGPGALLRDGALRAELETAVRRRIDHGLYRAGLARRSGPRPAPRATALDQGRRR